MGSSSRFTRPCSTCGRNLEIPIVHLGREVACSHCGARFVASMTDDVLTNGRDSQNLDDRIDRLLAASATSSKRFHCLKTENRESAASTSYEV